MRAASRIPLGFLVVMAFAMALAVGAPASGSPEYSGSTGVSSTGVPGGGGGGGGGRVLFYDLANTDANVSWPSNTQFFSSNLCGYLQPLLARNRSLSESQRALCERRVAARILGVNASEVNPAGDSQCTIASTGPCWRNVASDPHGVSNPPRVGRNGWNELHWSNYGESNQVSTAGTVIAWNIKVWRYDPYSGTGRTAEPIFERRVGLDGGSFTDDGTAPGCSVSSAAGCVTQDEWWRGGRSQPAGNYWWRPGATAGPLGPKPSGASAAACQTRWNSYRSRWSDRNRVPSLESYVGLSGGNACFWVANDGGGNGYDTSTLPHRSDPASNSSPLDMESIAVGWSFTTLPGKVQLKYRIVGQPGYLYGVLVTPIDQREQIVGPGQVQARAPTVPGGYFRSFFAGAGIPNLGQVCGTTYINRTPGAASPERGIAGVRIAISGPEGRIIQSGANGRFCAAGLPPGVYTLVATPPAGSQARTPNPPRRANVRVPSGGTVDDQDFHFYLPGGASLQAGISGYAFEDLDQNGRFDPGAGEKLLPGASFALTGTGPDRNASSADGNFAFSGLGAGSYNVAATAPAGYSATDDSDGPANGRSYVSPLPLNAGQQRGDVYFGFYRPCVECEQQTDAASGTFAAPQVSVAGPNTAITGRANAFGITTDWPAGGIGYDQAVWPLSSTTVLLDPQSGEVQEGPGGSVFGFPFYSSLLQVNEATSPVGAAYASAPTSTMSPCPGLPEGTPCGGAGLLARASALDITTDRDESGAFGNNAAVTPANPFQIRPFDVAWLTPSLDPNQPASIGGYATYHSGRLVQPVLASADNANRDWRTPQTSCGSAPAGSHCITSDTTLRPWASAAGLRLSDMLSGRHQLASVYQYHPFDSGFLSAHLTTNEPNRVESLSVYDRGSENGSRKGRLFADVNVAAQQLGITVAEANARRAAGTLRTAEDAGGWNIYFCRSGGWGDARIWNGSNLNFGSNSGQQIGDQGCRSDYYTFAWDQTANDCRATRPPQTVNYLSGRVPAGAHLRGQLPWDQTPRRCTYQVNDGYVQSGTWEQVAWAWDVDNGCSAQDPRNHPSPAGQPVPASGLVRCTFTSGGQTRNGWRTGHWYKPGYTFNWTGTCARTKPNLAALPPAPAAWGNAVRYNDAGGRWVYPGTRTQTNRLFDERGGTFNPDNVKRCAFSDSTGFQWNGTWSRNAAEQGHGSPHGRLDAGEYTIVADYRPGASSGTTWRINTNQFARRGSGWQWQTNAFGGPEMTREANTVTTAVLALQTTR